MENFEGAIVFVRTKNETETVAEKLRARGFDAEAINGDVAQAPAPSAPSTGSRTPGWTSWSHRRRCPRTGRRAHHARVQLRHPHRHRVLCTPDRPHRAGRSQRHRDLVRHPRERYLLRHIEQATRQSLVEMSLPRVDDVNTTRLGRFDDQITAALGDPSVPVFRDIVAHYVREHDVPEVDVAARWR